MGKSARSLCCSSLQFYFFVNLCAALRERERKREREKERERERETTERRCVPDLFGSHQIKKEVHCDHDSSTVDYLLPGADR